MASNGRTIHFPALIAVGGFGIAMVLTPTRVGFGDTWVSLAFLVWLAIGGVVLGLLLPGERSAGGRRPAAEKQVAMGGQIATVLLLVMLYLMIWKPGA